MTTTRDRIETAATSIYVRVTHADWLATHELCDNLSLYICAPTLYWRVKQVPYSLPRTRYVFISHLDSQFTVFLITVSWWQLLSSQYQVLAHDWTREDNSADRFQTTNMIISLVIQSVDCLMLHDAGTDKSSSLISELVFVYSRNNQAFWLGRHCNDSPIRMKRNTHSHANHWPSLSLPTMHRIYW